MDSEQYRAALKKLGLTQKEAADMLGISIRSSAGYAGGRPIPNAVEIVLRLMLRFQSALKPEDLRPNLLILRDVLNRREKTVPVKHPAKSKVKAATGPAVRQPRRRPKQ